MAGHSDEEYAELLSFLQDPKLEVQQAAADGVLQYTESEDFLNYCQRNPRKVAKPMMRLVERAEASSEAAIKDAKEKKKGQTTENLQAEAAGAAALKSLVNLSVMPAVRDELLSMNAIRRSIDSMRGGWLEGRTINAHWHAMLLVNLTQSPGGQEALCKDEGLVAFLVSAYGANPRPPPRDDVQDPLGCIGRVFANICVQENGRRVLEKAFGIGTLLKGVGERQRRCDALNAFHNLCVDKKCHEVLVETAFAAVLATFTYPWEKSDEEERERLGEPLMKHLNESGASLTSDVTIRCEAAFCCLGLLQTRAGRDYLLDFGFREVTRAWMNEEEDASVLSALHQAKKMLAMSDEEFDAELAERAKEPTDTEMPPHPAPKATSTPAAEPEVPAPVAPKPRPAEDANDEKGGDMVGLFDHIEEEEAAAKAAAKA